MRRVHTLAIVSHVVHYRHAGSLWAYGPYSREIDIWADLFPDVVIAAPCRQEPPPRDCLAFTRRNLRIAPQREHGGETMSAKLAQMAALPWLVRDLARVLRQADAVHVRCPGNLGLLGALMAPLFSRRLVAKYAGQWNGYPGEPWTVALQRRVLRSRWWHGPVTVYGRWPNQPAHVVPFFTSMMTAEQVRRAARVSAGRRPQDRLRVLYSGVLAARKRVSALVDAVAAARDRGVDLELTIVGDGPERGAVEERVRARDLHDVVTFVGALPFDEVQRWYEWADCLVLPSTHSEGWPKVVAEAMSFGVICIAVAHGQLPEMLSGRGVLLSSGDADEIAEALADVARERERHDALAQRAAVWAGAYSLDVLRRALAALLSESWQAPVNPDGPLVPVDPCTSFSL